LTSTVAMVVLELCHAITRPVNTLLFASRNVAVACEGWPAMTDVGATTTLTVATGAGGGAVTVNVAKPD